MKYPLLLTTHFFFFFFQHSYFYLNSLEGPLPSELGNLINTRYLYVFFFSLFYSMI